MTWIDIELFGEIFANFDKGKVLRQIVHRNMVLVTCRGSGFVTWLWIFLTVVRILAAHPLSSSVNMQIRSGLSFPCMPRIADNVSLMVSGAQICICVFNYYGAFRSISDIKLQ